MFYDIFIELCKKKGVAPSKAAEDAGFNKGTVSSWKKNGYAPRKDIILKISDYFNVSVDYLLGNAETKKNLADDDKELEEYLNELKTRPEMRMLFSLAKGATKKDVEQAVAIIEALKKNE